MTSSNTPLRAADTPSHSLQVSNAQHQHQPLHFITHTEPPPPHHPPPMSQGKQQRWREREQRVGRPPGPAESACQLGKARWKQSHMMAAWAVAEGRCCFAAGPPGSSSVSQSRWGWWGWGLVVGGGVGRGAAMGRCRNGRTEKSEQAAAAASELPKGSGGNSHLPCKHRPSTHSTNLIMGGAPLPPLPSWHRHIPHFFSSSSSSSSLLRSLSLIVLIRQGWSGCQLLATPLKGGGRNNLWIWSSNSICVPVLTPHRG